MNAAQDFRRSSVRELTNQTGVYALCDLDEVPVYVGQSVDGIRSRVGRHLTSARSDIIANRQIDVWEIAFVWAWPMSELVNIPVLEAYLFGLFDAENPLMNGKVLEAVSDLNFDIPEKQRIQCISSEELDSRLAPSNRLPRQISHYLTLVDYIQNVKDANHLKRSLDAHFERLVRYHREFL